MFPGRGRHRAENPGGSGRIFRPDRADFPGIYRKQKGPTSACGRPRPSESEVTATARWGQTTTAEEAATAAEHDPAVMKGTTTMVDNPSCSGESDWRNRFIESAELMLKYTDGMLAIAEAFDTWREEMKQQRQILLDRLKDAHDQEIDGLFNDGAEFPDA